MFLLGTVIQAICSYPKMGVFVKTGAKAIATGSAPVAMANGYPDGEQFPLNDALTVAKRILQSIDLPLTMDLEGGYGADPEAVAQTVRSALETGADRV